MKDPQTPEQWQEAVDLAHGALALDAARQYGLVIGGPEIDVERCDDILRRGRERNVSPATDAIDKFIEAHRPRPGAERRAS